MPPPHGQLLAGLPPPLSPLCAAEVLKRRVAGLHQISETSSLELLDVYEPKEEGLERWEGVWRGRGE